MRHFSSLDISPFVYVLLGLVSSYTVKLHPRFYTFNDHAMVCCELCWSYIILLWSNGSFQFGCVVSLIHVEPVAGKFERMCFSPCPC